MDLGNKMMLQRKKKNLSQVALGKLIGTSGDVIGRYERGDITPSIGVVHKIADALEVSIDFLIGKSSVELDKETLKRLENIAALSDKDKEHLFALMDAFLRDNKAKAAYS